MNHNDAPQMASYPSPPAPGHNGFYPASSQDQRQPDPEGLQLAAQLSGSLADPLMRQGEDETVHAQMAGQMDASQNHQYEGQQAQQLNHQMNHEGMDHGQGSSYGTPGTPGTAIDQKKRTKVSRACDECRRKKIRCDAFSEDATCSNCKRVGARCQFSRVPQKRGPSKGYIKELSDRVNNLEAREARHSMHGGEVSYAPMNPDGASPRGFEDFSPGANGGGLSHPRKRNHSAISNDFNNSPYQGYRQALDWSNQPRQMPPPSSAYQGAQASAGGIVDASYPSYSPDSMAPQPTWRNAPDGARRMSTSLETTSHSGQGQADRHLDWSSVLERYYATIHPLFPILPSSQPKLLARISRPNCTAVVEDALYEAVQSVNSCVLVEGVPRPESGNSRGNLDDAIKTPFDAPGSRTMASNIIHLQAMVFRIIEADNLGPGSMGQRALWLGLAVGLAATMKLHIPLRNENPGDLDPDSDELLGRRVWWCLVILDRWHALSTSSPVMIPDSSVVPFQEDKIILGETTYQLARLSIVIGHLAGVSILPRESSDSASGAPFLPFISSILNGEMERCRESFQITDPSMYPVLHLNVLYLRLLTKRADPTIEPIDLLQPAVEMVQIFRNASPITPFNHHFAAVAALTLVELRNVHGIEDGNQAIQFLTEGSAGRNINNEGKDWYSAMMALILTKSGPTSSKLKSRAAKAKDGSSQGASLHHLADLATAEGDNRTESQPPNATTTATNAKGQNAETAESRKEDEASSAEKWDPSVLITNGYLCALASYSK